MKLRNGSLLVVRIKQNYPYFCTITSSGDVKKYRGTLPEGFETTTFKVDEDTLKAIRENGGVENITPGGNVEIVDYRQFILNDLCITK